MIHVICGDVRDMPVAGKFHAALMDPPYELGFMGKSWDASGVVYDVEMWKAILDLLYPGAFGMAFASSRTYHRLACAIEDAGAELHPMIYGWAFGSGFPKATRIDTQIDKAAEAEREVVATVRKLASAAKCHEGWKRPWAYENGEPKRTMDIEAPATPLARVWAGHRYGKQCLKPAIEPICCFQHPYGDRPVDCITETGAGTLNIEQSRIGTGAITSNRWDDDMHPFGEGAGNTYTPYVNRGRWPANLILQHHPECVRVGEKRVRGIGGGDATPPYESELTWNVSKTPGGPSSHYTNETVADWRCHPSCPVRKLGEQSGELKSGDLTRSETARAEVGKHDIYGAFAGKPDGAHFPASTGSASRFFAQVSWQLDHAEPVRYCAKASRRERDAGLEGFERYKQDPSRHAEQPSMNDGNGNPYNRGVVPVRNSHPCCKPIALAKYLATLLLPPPEYAPRRLLIPFSGVGSEAIGAMLAGWEEIVCIEQSPEYCEIAAARVKWWQKRMQQTGSADVKVLLRPAPKQSKLQMALL